MPRILVSICLCCLSIGPAAARMYQWQNPATGTTQLSGAPPVWYRSEQGGPRVLVFDNNQLVDDTGIAVSAMQAEQLRGAAFGALQAEGVGHKDAPSRDQARASIQPAGAASTAQTPAVVVPEAAAATPTTNDIAAGKAATLKALLDAWDQRQVDQARSLLERLPGDDKSTSEHR